MLFWIDATQPESTPKIFGLSPLERQLRIIKKILAVRALKAPPQTTLDQIAAIGPQLASEFGQATSSDSAIEVRIELPEGAQIPHLPES